MSSRAERASGAAGGRRAKKRAIPFMRDMFAMPSSPRGKATLLGSRCDGCGDYFFPKVGSCPFCLSPDQVREVKLSPRGKLVSHTLTRAVPGAEETHASGIIQLPEGLQVNSVLTEWGGSEENLCPGAPMEMVLRKVGEDEEGNDLIGYMFRPVRLKVKVRKPPPVAAAEPERPAPPPAPPPKRAPARPARAPRPSVRRTKAKAARVAPRTKAPPGPRAKAPPAKKKATKKTARPPARKRRPRRPPPGRKLAPARRKAAAKKGARKRR
ncbi:MAG: Zn-ribbon domain-containing OB-fold protein [Nitrospinota bacterium]